MDMAIVKFVGSGLATVSNGLGFTVPPSAIRNGYAMIDYLSKHKAVETSKLLQDITSDIWTNWDQGAVPRDAALKELKGLPIILSNNCPPPNYFVNGLVGAAALAAKGKVDIASGGRVIAAEIIMRGRETNAFEKAGLNEQLCYFLLERLMVQLLSRFELLEELKPMLQSYFLHKLWRDAQGAGFAAPPENTSTPLEAVSTLAAAATTAGVIAGTAASVGESQSGTLEEAGIGAGAISFADDIDGIVELDALHAAAVKYANLLDNAQSDDARTLLRLQLGRLRYRIGELGKNVEMLEEARELLNTGLVQPLLLDKAGIRRKAQIDLAELLWELSRITGERSLVEEAAQTLEPVCKSLRATADLTIWVTTHMLLASIYQGLSRDQAGTENLLLAAQYFEKAGERLSQTAQPVEWATLANKLSYVLELIGVRSQDVDVLNQAAEVKRAAIDIFELHGDSALLETLRDELYSLHDEMQKLNRPEKAAIFSQSA